MKDGLGCNASHYAPAELQGKIVPDEHLHEHATCFNVKDRGLVVISSCGHVGIVNSARQAQEVSGVQKVHALVGGFHLGPAPADYLNQVVDEIKKLDPDVIVPMHCSGDNFVRAVREKLPDKLLVSYDRQPLTSSAPRHSCASGSGREQAACLRSLRRRHRGRRPAVGCCGRARRTERSAAELMDVLMWSREPVGGPFALIDHAGRRAPTPTSAAICC